MMAVTSFMKLSPVFGGLAPGKRTRGQSKRSVWLCNAPVPLGSMIGTLRPDLALLRSFDAATCRPPATASSAAPVLLQCTPHPGQSRKLASSGNPPDFKLLAANPGIVRNAGLRAAHQIGADALRQLRKSVQLPSRERRRHRARLPPTRYRNPRHAAAQSRLRSPQPTSQPPVRRRIAVAQAPSWSRSSAP